MYSGSCDHKSLSITAQVDVPHLTAVDEAGQASNVGARLV